MKTRTLPALVLLCTLAVASCKKDKQAVLEGDWLFPIARASFSLNSLNMFRHFGYYMEVRPEDIQQPVGTPVSSPGLFFSHLGPAKVPLSDCIARLDVDTLSFSGTLTNNFPVAIGAGTRLVMRTAMDTTSAGTIAGFATLPQDIPPGGSYSFDVLVSKKILGDHVYLYLEDFRTPAFSKLVFHAEPTILDAHINVITASYAQVFTDRECLSQDTTEFSVGGQDQSASQTNGAVSDTAMSGVINVFADNSLPTKARIQLYFLNADKTQVLDSLFYPAAFEVDAGRTAESGSPLSIASARAKVLISRNKLERLKRASFVASRLYLSTMGLAGNTLSADRTATLKLQFTGDLHLNIRF